MRCRSILFTLVLTVTFSSTVFADVIEFPKQPPKPHPLVAQTTAITDRLASLTWTGDFIKNIPADANALKEVYPQAREQLRTVNERLLRLDNLMSRVAEKALASGRSLDPSSPDNSLLSRLTAQYRDLSDAERQLRPTLTQAYTLLTDRPVIGDATAPHPSDRARISSSRTSKGGSNSRSSRQVDESKIKTPEHFHPSALGRHVAADGFKGLQVHGPSWLAGQKINRSTMNLPQVIGAPDIEVNSGRIAN